MYFYCYVYVFLLYVYVSSSCQLALFGYPDWGVFCAFSTAVGPVPRYNSQRWGTPRALPKNFGVFCVLFVWVVLFCVLFVYACVLYYCHWVATQLQFNKYISYRIIIYHIYIYIIIIYHVISYITYHITSYIIYVNHFTFCCWYWSSVICTGDRCHGSSLHNLT